MNKKLSGLVGIFLSVVILVYFEIFSYKVLDAVGMNVSNYSSVIQTIINLIIKFIMCFIVYMIYKKDFRSKKGNDSLLKNVLLFVIGLITTVVGMYLFSFVVKYIGDIFDVSVIEKSFYNIFDKKLDLDLIIKILSDYVVVPYLYCSIILLSVDKLVKRNDTFIVLSGLLASIIHALTLSGTLGFVIVNSLSTLLLFSLFAFIYRKNSSIWFLIVLYSFYLISNVFIINYLGW